MLEAVCFVENKRWSLIQMFYNIAGFSKAFATQTSFLPPVGHMLRWMHRADNTNPIVNIQLF